MSDHYLRFTDETTALAAMAAAGMDGNTGDGWAAEWLGTLYDAPPTDAHGAPTGPGTQKAGYHVNVRLRGGDLHAGLVPSEVFPAVPNRRFA